MEIIIQSDKDNEGWTIGVVVDDAQKPRKTDEIKGPLRETSGKYRDGLETKTKGTNTKKTWENPTTPWRRPKENHNKVQGRPRETWGEAGSRENPLCHAVRKRRGNT